MLLNKIITPTNKNELVRQIQSLKQLKFKIIDEVKRNELSSVKYEMEKFIGSDEVCVIILKSK